MFKKSAIITAAAILAASMSVSKAEARDYISIVGSSTVYPFATVVAEQFGKTTKFKTPKIESTGSGGGLKLFCAGVGIEHPDVVSGLTNCGRCRLIQLKSVFLALTAHPSLCKKRRKCWRTLVWLWDRST